MKKTKFLSLNVETIYGLGVRTLQNHWAIPFFIRTGGWT